MALTAGTRLGAYQILAPLGAGGMGEVYRATDTRLGREVAVKVVSGHLMDDVNALARFEREARTVAALSHPNIVALYDVGRQNGVVFAVMELLQGETLERYLSTQPPSWSRALDIAVSVADGLASAHAKGLVHRDLKPANIFITDDGLVKLLDFGLAKEDPFRSTSQTGRPTAAAETAPGAILGTVGYMSPEQVRGERADHRSDIFSLGCVLYETLSGRRPFRGDTPAETLAAILRDQPSELATAEGQLPPRVGAVVRRCLEKNPDQRFQSARDLAFALREILNDSQTPLRPGTATFRTRVRRGPVLVTAFVLIVLAAVVWFNEGVRSLLAPEGGRIRSLAVLPLRNLSGDSGQDYFADAMTEELTTRLSKLGNWRVTSRTSVMGYRGTRKKIPEIARELAVDAILEGSVIRDGSRVKITAQLIDGRTDHHLWAETYEREVASVLAIQNDVARAVAREVDVKLTPEADAGLAASTRTVVPAAYDACARGRHAWDKRSKSDLRDAIRFFQESLDADPTYAPAYVGMADSYAQLGYGSFISPEDAFPRARAAASRALDLDPTLAEAHAALGYSLMYYDWKFSAAEAEFKRALDLNPNNAIARQWYAYLLTALERPLSDAEREISTAKSLDPLSVPINTDRAFVLHYYGRNEEALRSVGLAMEMNPKFALGYFWLGRIYTSEGRYEEAETAFQKIGPLRTWTPAMSARGYLYAKSGRPEDARNVLAGFDDLQRQGRYASSFAIAVIYAGLGDRERVFSYLDAAYRERSHWLVWLKRDPRWNDVRSDARFQDLVRKIGLPS
jgi:serine/threonine-protein kinase